jgi:hypothetical protein
VYSLEKYIRKVSPSPLSSSLSFLPCVYVCACVCSASIYTHRHSLSLCPLFTLFLLHCMFFPSFSLSLSLVHSRTARRQRRARLQGSTLWTLSSASLGKRSVTCFKSRATFCFLPSYSGLSLACKPQRSRGCTLGMIETSRANALPLPAFFSVPTPLDHIPHPSHVLPSTCPPPRQLQERDPYAARFQKNLNTTFSTLFKAPKEHHVRPFHICFLAATSVLPCPLCLIQAAMCIQSPLSRTLSEKLSKFGMNRVSTTGR